MAEKGDILSWRGPWGTIHPMNLRLYMANVTQGQWDHGRESDADPAAEMASVEAVRVRPRHGRGDAPAPGLPF